MSSKILAEWFWTDRWMGSSGFLLPMEARGVYREMLTQAWRRGARLPNDHEAIIRAIGATKAEWRRAWPLVGRFWRVDGDALVNETQTSVYAEAVQIIQRASEHGRSGARARYEHNPSHARAQPEHSPSHARAQPEDKPPISVSVSEDQNTRTRARAVARAQPEDKIFSPSRLPKALTERAGRWVERYAELYQHHRRGARYISRPALDFQEACELCRVWDDARLEKIAQVFLTTDHEFAEKGSRTMAQFRSMASWCDGRLAEAGL